MARLAVTRNWADWSSFWTFCRCFQSSQLPFDDVGYDILDIPVPRFVLNPQPQVGVSLCSTRRYIVKPPPPASLAGPSRLCQAYRDPGSRRRRGARSDAASLLYRPLDQRGGDCQDQPRQDGNGISALLGPGSSPLRSIRRAPSFTACQGSEIGSVTQICGGCATCSTALQRARYAARCRGENSQSQRG